MLSKEEIENICLLGPLLNPYISYYRMTDRIQLRSQRLQPELTRLIRVRHRIELTNYRIAPVHPRLKLTRHRMQLVSRRIDSLDPRQ